MKPRTVAYVSGAVCGHLWWPDAPAGRLLKQDARGPFGFYQEGDGWSFRDALEALLMREGGDFRNALFTADTVFRIERRHPGPSPYAYAVQVWERSIADLPDCADLVSADRYTSDLFQEEE